ncbi:neuropeptide FF receptor 1-like [Actinia tenebrosa]|uniref:Neuropeptide FF receptor 1-like n=1 Tax=Actinia tenebrosa TaxID=6105 RepID=A0A6P8I7P3_ACTTE|nr:neuropeptide FF receptor 1-like [Actinia tenebrosa]
MNNSTHRVMQRPSTPYRLISHEMEIYIYLVTLVIGVIGNGLVLCSIATRRRRRLTANDVFIMNLTLSDLLLLLVFLPFAIYIRLAPFKPTAFICKFMAPIITVALGGTIFTLAVMAIQRCFTITHPFRQEMTVKMASLTILGIWFLSIAISFPKIVNAMPKRNKCYIRWKYPFHKKAYMVGLFVVRFAIPFVLIMISYVKMGIALLRTQSPRFTTDSKGNIRNVTNREENVAVIKTLVLITALFLVCMLPYRVSLLLMTFSQLKRNMIVINVYSTAAILTIAHSCINPIIYGAFLKQFKNDYKRLVLNILCCKNCRKKQNLGQNVERSDGIELREDDGLSSSLWKKSESEVKTVQVSLSSNHYRQVRSDDGVRIIENKEIEG